MTEKRLKPKYICKKCDIKFYTEEAASDHIVQTGRYSPKDHMTYLHQMEKTDNDNR